MEERSFAREMLERYSGSPVEKFQPLLILTNFPQYVKYFASLKKLPVDEGSMFKVTHCPDEGVSVLDFKIGSPAAALAIDLCSFLPVKAAVFLGMCGGLRDRYQVGDYLVPTASIRDEGTSNFYFPPCVPAMANFLMQKAVTEVLNSSPSTYHIGITYTSNMRFWEFHEPFIARLKETQAQAIEMECATLFMASYKRRFNLGALLLISDLPLGPGGLKTKDHSAHVFDQYMDAHLMHGMDILNTALCWQRRHIKGAYQDEEIES